MYRFLKELGKAVLIGTLVFLVICIVGFATGGFVFSAKRLLVQYGYNQLYAVPIYFANVYFFNAMRRKYGGALFQLKNLATAVFGGVGITLAALFCINLFIALLLREQGLSAFLAAETLKPYYIGFVISMVVTAIFYSIYYYKYKKERQVKEQKLIAGTASAKFDALKNQLDPHFLFNSLNVLTSLIEENPAAATKFTTSLSKVYRYVLEQKNKELVAVTEELAFAQLYMGLLKMRFEDSIVFTFPQKFDAPGAKVVPLSLQLLLENAVKHNQVTGSKKLHITITETNGYLRVSNNLQPKQVLKKSTGVGLQNITQRYRLLTKRPVTVLRDAAQFTIAIPLLSNAPAATGGPAEHIAAKRYQNAKEQVEKIKGFYVHLAFYTVFVPVFIVLNIRSGTSFPWALFPIVGWGMGVLGHASETFNWDPFFNKEWEERKIREYMDRDL